jgi:hypothetical protein
MGAYDRLTISFPRLLSLLPTRCSVSTGSVLRSTLSTHYPMPSAADPGATMTFVAGGALKPIGGHILSHASATRIFLRKGVSRQFVSLVSAHCAALTPRRFELNIL